MKLKFLIFLMVVVAWLLNTANVKAQEVTYQPKLLTKSFAEIKTILEKELLESISYSALHKEKDKYASTKRVLVFDDRMEITYFLRRKSPVTYYFKDLEDYPIKAVKLAQKNVTYSRSEIRIGDLTFLGYSIHTLDCLFTIRYNLVVKKLEDNLNDFKLNADIYRSLKEKPAISEEQRKFIVQANLFTQQKNFNKAIEWYQKVIQINPISFPAAYSNLALLYANLSDYQMAIYDMKLYLMLEHEAADARASQDKIYEWEAML